MKLTDSQTAVAKIIYTNPPITRLEILKRTQGGWKSSHICRAIDAMIDRKMIECAADVLSLSEELREYMVMRAPKGDLVKPAEPRPFKPLSEKYMVTAQGTRDDAPPREFHPISCGSNVSPHSPEGY